MVGSLATVARRPLAGAVIISVAIAFVGVWVALPIGVYVPPATLACLLVCLALAPAFSWRASSGDVLVAAAFWLVGLSVLVGSSVTLVLGDLVFGALPAYLAGRMLVERLGLTKVAEVIAVVWAAAAVLGLLEAVTGFNPFVLVPFPNSLYSEWAVTQERAGIARVEGAFGHSIAYATCMAAGIPLVAVTRWSSRARCLMMALLVAATLPSLSRTGMACAVLALLLSLTVLRTGISRRWRLRVIGLLAAIGVIAFPRLLDVFALAGEEQAGSARYRSDLLVLVRYLRFIGVSPAGRRNNTGSTWAGFGSVDDELLRAALCYGWAPVVLLLVGFSVVCWRVLARRANAAQTAVVALAPAYVTVAFITQLSTVVWLIIGMALSAEKAAHTMTRISQEPTDEPQGDAGDQRDGAPRAPSGLPYARPLRGT